ncbi:MAG: hypothetical protein HQK88_15405 [Nitrospirae bacterium]|nr:hypothetical protein [Nitrospirota bacterium]MBF0536188.1 hypothetical protein [Nitrospirota bacterium]MBF0618188.1 hypothetical protein [Nitrospirota bacterium]
MKKGFGKIIWCVIFGIYGLSMLFVGNFAGGLFFTAVAVTLFILGVRQANNAELTKQKSLSVNLKKQGLAREHNISAWAKVFEKTIEDKYLSEEEFLELEELQKRLGLTDADTKKYWKRVNFKVVETEPLTPAVVNKSVLDFLTNTSIVVPTKNVVYKSIEDFLPDISGWILTVSFGKSSSNNFAQVLSSIQIHPGYQLKQGPNKEEIHELNFNAEEILQFDELWLRIKNWKSTIVKINNEIIDKRDISKLLICYRDKLKQKITNPLFCFGASPYTYNLFGCHRTMIRDGAGTLSQCWYDLGKFINNNVFQVNKEEIAGKLIKEIYPYRICPALRRDKIIRGYNIIPSKIDISKEQGWSIDNNYDGKRRLFPTIKYTQRKISEVSSGNFNISLSAYMSMPNYEESISPQFKHILDIEKSGAKR